MQLATELADLSREEAAFYSWPGLYTGAQALAGASEWADEVTGLEDANKPPRLPRKQPGWFYKTSKRKPTSGAPLPAPRPPRWPFR